MNNKAGPLLDPVGTGSTKDEIRRFFDDMSIGRNETIRKNPIICYEQETRAQTVLDLLAVKPGERILDVGCGNARDMSRILESGGQVVGVDISEGMVEAARQELECVGKSGMTLQVGDVTCLDFPDAYFDKVLCSEVIEHIPDASQALREIYRVLRPGGSLVLSTPNKASWYGLDRYWIWERLLGRKWTHPCDEWRNMAELLNLVGESCLKVRVQKSVCFTPGFIITYFLFPRMLQRLLVKVVGYFELRLQRWCKSRGYMVCVLAIRETDD